MIDLLWPIALVVALCVFGIPAAASLLFAGAAAFLAILPGGRFLSVFGTITVDALSTVLAIIPILMFVGAGLQALGLVQTFPVARTAKEERGAWYAGGILGAPLPIAVSIVFLCVLTETSIAKAIVNGFLPGIFLSLVYLVIFTVSAARNGVPDLQRRDGGISAALILSRIFVPVVFILLAVVPIFVGIFTPMEAVALAGLLVAIFVLLVAWFAESGWRRLLAGITAGTQGFGNFLLVVIGLLLLGYALNLGGGPANLARSIEAWGVGVGPFLLAISVLSALIGIVIGALPAIGIVVIACYPAGATIGIDPIQTTVALFLTAEAIRVGPRLGRPGGSDEPTTSWPYYGAAMLVVAGYAFLPASLALALNW